MRAPRASNDPRFAAPPETIAGDPRVIVWSSRVIRWTITAGIAIALLAAWLIADAETLTGRVVGISDGDTITVLVGRERVKVRLVDIDAPESKQPWGTRSKQALSAICFNKAAQLETAGRDRYGRTIATVYCAGRDANAEQVRQGMAWVFDRYARPDSPLYGLQREAQAARRALWSDPQPMPPWEWRASKH